VRWRENGLFIDAANKARYDHDGRFKTLLDTVDHHDALFGLGLSGAEERPDRVPEIAARGQDERLGGALTRTVSSTLKEPT
jgi:hypothetical protein